MGEVDISSLIAMSRPAPPAYQEDENSERDVIRPVPLRTLDGKEAEILLRPGDPRWNSMFAPRYDSTGRQVNTMAPDFLPGGDEPGGVIVSGRRAKPKKPKGSDQTVGMLQEVTEAVSRPRAAAKPVARRLVINYARDGAMYVVTVEESPDWDIVGRPKKVSRSGLMEMLPLVVSLGIKVKNATEEEWGI